MSETRGKPRCNCCNGAGMHEHRPYLTASPYDIDTECTKCEGTGETWHHARPNSCMGYNEMIRGRR